MTLVSEIIKAAYRESNLIPLGADPSSNQSTEALDRLNPLVLSTVGREAGDDLEDLNIDGDYDQESLLNTWLPANVRLLLNLDEAKSYDLDPYPAEGQRLAFVDVAGNLATYNVVLDGNGRNIEGSSTVTLSTNSDARHWLYRADTGNWVKISSLLTSDEMPFPVDFDDYFVIMLAARLNPRYGQSLSAETVKMLTRARSHLQSRYNKRREVESDAPYRELSGNKRTSYSFSGDNFAKGRPYPWR